VRRGAEPERRALKDVRLTVVALFLAAILLLIFAVPTIVASSIVDLGDRVILDLDQLLALQSQITNILVDQETSQRGYILTGDERFLEPYQRGRSRLEPLWQQAQQQAEAVGGQAPALLAAEREAAQRWQAEAAEPEIALVRAGRSAEAVDAVRAGTGKALFDVFRERATTFDTYIQQVRQEATARRTQLTMLLDRIIIVLALAGLVGLGLIYYLTAVSRQYLVQAMRGEELNRAKNEFLSIVSHELKTPLTVIRLHAQSLLRRERRRRGVATAEAGRPDLRDLIGRVAIIDEQAKRMARLVEQLVDLTRGDALEFPLQCEIVDLVALTRHVVDQFRPLAPDGAFAFSSERSEILVSADPIRLEQVLQNLLGNALKYSPEGGEIRVALAVREIEVVCSIQDQGIGLPAAELPYVFDRFYRASNATATQISGLGLGLYLSREIIHRHGGRIWAESTEGQGSTFSFSLPLAQPGGG